MFFKKRKTAEKANDEYLDEIKTATSALPTESLMSAALFAAMDRANDAGLSEDERTDIHVAGLSVYRDLCVAGILEIVGDHPDKVHHFRKNAMMNAVVNYSEFLKLTQRIGFSMRDVSPPTANQEAERKVQDAPTVKDLLIVRAPPWNRVAPVVIKTILAAITDKGLLEAFVMHSMNAGLVARYEELGGDSDPRVIRAQISQILCETGNRAIPTLTKALAAKQKEAATKALTLAGDTFEAAITLAKNQIAAYAGLATIYGLVGKGAEAHKYARLGLSELEKMRQDPASRALRDSAIFPADILDQMERQLRTLLASA